MTFHWEFTLGSDRVHEIIDTLPFPALGQNIFDAEWDEPANILSLIHFSSEEGRKLPS